MTAQANGVAVELADGTRTRCSALIAADGLWSRVRPPVSALRNAGARAFRAVIPARHLPHEVSATSTHIWLSPHAHVVHYPVRAFSEIALVAAFADTGQDGEVSGDIIRKQFANAPRQLRELLMQPEYWHGWPLMEQTHVPARASGRIALVGDAARPILPYLAQGGVMAMEDAVTIASKIAHTTTIARAFASYADERTVRVERVARAARRNGSIYHLGGAAAVARNGVLRAIPGSRLLASYDWLYGWRIDAGREH